MNRIQFYDIFIVYILLVELELDLSTVSLFDFGLIILIFIMSFILIFKSILVFMNSENVCLSSI